MKSNVNYLVVGSGNIAKRHIKNIKQLFSNGSVGCISSSGKKILPDDVGAEVVFATLKEAIETSDIKFAIIASPASSHIQHAIELLAFGIPVLIEKPLADSLATYHKKGDTLYLYQQKIEIAYNLRYLPSANVVKHYLDQGELGKLHTVLVDVGQYLPDWRPDVDYRQTVSAKKSLGGGVLLELSHEIDYLTWFFGNFTQVFCHVKNSGLLEIDVEDCADAIFMRKDGLVVNLHMDLLQRAPHRTCKIIGEMGTLFWDILNNRVTLKQQIMDELVLFDDPHYDKNQMYVDELIHFSKVVSGDWAPMVDLKQGLRVLNLIDAMKLSSSMGQSVNLDLGRMQ